MQDVKRLAATALLLLALMGCGGRERIGAVSAPADWRPGQVLRGTSVTMPVPPAKPKHSVSVQIAKAAPPPPAPAPISAPTPAPKPVVKAEPLVKNAGWVVQLGALDSASLAKGAWKAAVSRHDVLKDKALVESRTIAKGRTVHRIAAGGFASAPEARAACEALKADGAACFVRSG